MESGRPLHSKTPGRVFLPFGLERKTEQRQFFSSFLIIDVTTDFKRLTKTIRQFIEIHLKELVKNIVGILH